MFPLLPFPDPNEFAFFTLVMGRMAGLFSAIPLFGGKSVPARIKVVTIFTMTLLFYPMVRSGIPVLPTDSLSIGFLVLREALVGLSLGLLSQIIFSAVEFCGQLIGMQMGFTVATMFDPTMGTQVSIMSVLQNLLAMLLFMTMGMHHVFIRAIVESYSIVPAGSWHMSSGLLQFVISATTGIFILALKLAAPVMASLVAATVALGVMARSFPQMNIFMISFPLSIGLGLLVLGGTLLVFFHTLSSAFTDLSRQIPNLLKLLGP
ncbi:MAG: flagellar biosynthetic protein FliR [Deltaproteobacteria bacterium]|nr:flagellar biosynthetic protein FliR [Deltaproteobacteria bacterium]